MKKIAILLTISFSLVLSGCDGRFEKDGLIYKIGNDRRTYIVDISDELRDDELVYIPPVLRFHENGEPMEIILSSGPWLGGPISSNALRILYVTGGKTGFEDGWYDNIDNLEMVVFNTLSPTYFPRFDPYTTILDIIQYYFLILYSHESYSSVVQYYDSKWDAEIEQQDWEPPVGIRKSRISFYFNYEDSPNEGLYRIGMEYEIGIDLTPPEDPTREGYQFIGWSSDAMTFIPYDFATSEYDVDVQLYAHWE